MPARNRIVAVRTILSLIMIAAPASSQEPQQRGRLHIVWDVDGGAALPREHYLVDDAGRAVQLRAQGIVAERLLSIDRRIVDVRIAAREGGATPSATLLDAAVVDGGVFANAMASGADAYNFITLLCQFADDATEPFTRADVERVHGSAYPGVQHFFAELSWDDDIMRASRVAGWYQLPLSRSAYVSQNGMDVGALARDCTAAADAEVHFPDYYGINLQFSNGLSTRPVAPYDTLSFGGSWTLTRDGVTRSWGMTWLSSGHALNYVVLTHEMGHAIGWPHSSGDYGDEYDSYWDIMSRGYIRFEQPYGWLGVHTVAQHKDAAGWVPDDRRWTPALGAVESGYISQTALPGQTGYLFALIPSDINSYYTVEARRTAGHDRPLPADAIVLHHVSFGRATVVDIDNNGNPNDAAAQWTVGETFHDSINGVTIEVASESHDGFNVNITRGWRLDLAVSGNGRIVGAGAAGSNPFDCDSACVVVRTQRGASFTLEPSAADGWRFVEWRGACTGWTTCTGSLAGNRSVEAVFMQGAIVRTDALEPGTMGADYSGTLSVDGASGATDWVIVDGGFPRGMELNAATGVISGVPAEAGTFALTVEVHTSSGGLLAPFTIRIDKPTLALQQVIDQLFGRTVLSTNEVRFLDLLGNANGTLDIGDVRRWLIDASHLTAAERSAAAALLRTGGSVP